MSTLADKRFVLVTGKGGVGKTTVCAAEALSLAAQGKRVLVAMCNAKERISTMLGSAPVGADVIEVAPGVSAVNMVPEQALAEYGALVLHSRIAYKALFENRVVKAFLRAVPGMQEWAMLGKAWWHTTETRPDGSPKYDVVILDAPATGHGIDMLRVPKVILDVVPTGLLRRDAERAWQLFQDEKSTAIVVVTLPEEMPTTETIELAGALSELGLRVGRIVVNCVLPRLFSDAERACARRAARPGPAGGEVAGRARRLRRQGPRGARARAGREPAAAHARALPGTRRRFSPAVRRPAATPAALRELAKRV